MKKLTYYINSFLIKFFKIKIVRARKESGYTKDYYLSFLPALKKLINKKDLDYKTNLEEFKDIYYIDKDFKEFDEENYNYVIADLSSLSLLDRERLYLFLHSKDFLIIDLNEYLVAGKNLNINDQ